MFSFTLTRRQFVLGSLAGVGMLMLPSDDALAMVTRPNRHRPAQPRVWLRGDPRTGCSQYPGAEWNLDQQLS